MTRSQTKRRYLRRLKRLTDQRFFVYDTETGFKQKNGSIKYDLHARPEAYIFGVVYGIINGIKHIKILYSPKQAKEEFKKRIYRDSIIFMHNAEYDLCATYGDIFELDSEAIFNGKFISASNGNCTFADSINLLQTSVKELGKMVGLEKQELGTNLISNDLNKDIEYCITDCKIVYKALSKIFSHSTPSLTIGSLALKIFRHDFLDRSIKINKLSDEFFKAYYGGRNEAFFLGECTAYVFDINSAYSFAMKNCKFPNPSTLLKKILHPGDELDSILSDNEGMITCKVRYIKNIDIPILPIRMNSKLIFPLGEFSGSWTFLEFRYALPFIEIMSECEVIYSEPMESPLASFVDYYYGERLKTDNKFENYYYKLFLNNLYGKFMQCIDEKYIFIKDRKNVYDQMKRYKCKRAELINTHRGYFLRMKLPRQYTSHTVACWGAQITAMVRIIMHKALTAVPCPLYCDTDSIFSETPLPKKFIGTLLGQWKKEDKIVTKILGLKNYKYFSGGKEKRKLKGVKHNAKETKPNVFEYPKMIKTKESYKRKDRLPAGIFIPQKKVITGDYDKRIVMRDGTTKPIIL